LFGGGASSGVEDGDGVVVDGVVVVGEVVVDDWVDVVDGVVVDGPPPAPCDIWMRP
jgi:hypothetical protein